MKSNCDRSRVGACVVSAAGGLLAIGYNQRPAGPCPREASGLPSTALFIGAGTCTAVHAEVDAVGKAGGWENLRGALVYVTREPCVGCWELLSEQPLAAVIWPGGRRDL